MEFNTIKMSAVLYKKVHTLCGYIPVCSGREDTVRGCGVGGVSGGVESEMWEGGRDSSTGCEVNTVMGVVKHEEVTSLGPAVTCEYMVGGVVVLAGGGGS